MREVYRVSKQYNRPIPAALRLISYLLALDFRGN